MAVYWRILRTPAAGVLLAATMISRLPFAINGLALILFLREATGSFATAGATAGALALGAGVAAPLAARLVDRRGVRWLLVLACGHAASILALWPLGATGAPAPALFASAFAAGMCFPPSGSVLRSRWPQLLGEDPALVRGAYALDSVGIEVSFIAGPLLTAVVVALVEPQAALALSAVLVVAGTSLFLARLPHEPRMRPREVEGRGLLGALTAPAIRTVALTTLPVGFCLGAIEVAIPAFSIEINRPELAGLLLALWSAASAAGGLAFGAIARRGHPADTYLAMGLLFPLACAPVALAGSPVAMAGLIVLAGLPIAPLIASRNELVAGVAPSGAEAESFTWLMTSLIAGIAAGTAIGGAVIEADGWGQSVLVGAVVALAGGGLAVARRKRLRPPALVPAGAS